MEFPTFPNQRVLLENTWPTFNSEVVPMLPRSIKIGFEPGPIPFEIFHFYCGEILNRVDENSIGLLVSFSHHHEGSVKIRVVDWDEVNGIPFDMLTIDEIVHGLEEYQTAALHHPEYQVVSCILCRDGDFIFMSEKHYMPSIPRK